MSAQAKKRPVVALAEFNTVEEVKHAAEGVRDRGYKNWDVHTPYPVHGMDAAMGLEDSRLGWIVLACGLSGVSLAVLMIQWMNGIDYPLIIGGKPPDAIPSMVPIMFELTVLLSAFGAVLGMLGLNQIPRHHHPVFYSERFDACSDNKFFISIEVEDPKWDVEKTPRFLETLGASHVEVVEGEE
ncbi:MAG: DUF3341 domain-containing protein [Myxococcales bacterium]|nr:DUF3341 domain-containing protein [Myxococcales bacterium]MDD9965920.1 DUF3341 domain-containing protein [Myxococcales bacterium]